jgi:hypothetical protein
MKSKWILTVYVGLVLVLLVGCGERPFTTILVTREVVVTRIVPEGAPVPSCTLLGCEDTVTIGLTGARPETFSIEVAYDSGRVIVHEMYRCENGRWAANNRPCTEIQLEAAPQAVTTTARWGESRITQEYIPDYEPFRPNGPDCEPVCQVSTVTFAFAD